jgi:hypothetical protein
VHRGEGLADVDVAEGDVARLVAQHALDDAAQQRAAGRLAHVVEGAEREPADDHVHADGDLHEVVGLQGQVDDSFSHGEIG